MGGRRSPPILLHKGSKANTKGSGNVRQDRKGRVTFAALDSPDIGWMLFGFGRQFLLSPPAPDSERPHPSAESTLNCLHFAIEGQAKRLSCSTDNEYCNRR